MSKSEATSQTFIGSFLATVAILVPNVAIKSIGLECAIVS